MDADTLRAAMPGLTRANADRYIGPIQAAMREFGITTEDRAVMWLAQTGHESGSLRRFEETGSGTAYEGRSDLGNTEPGDGERFKGRGPIRIIGRAAYTEASEALGLPLAEQPEMAADPQHAFRVSAEWWQRNGLNEIADDGDLEAATLRISDGLDGLDDRQSRYTLARSLGAAVLPGDTPEDEPPEGERVPARPGRGDDVPAVEVTLPPRTGVIGIALSSAADGEPVRWLTRLGPGVVRLDDVMAGWG